MQILLAKKIFKPNLLFFLVFKREKLLELALLIEIAEEENLYTFIVLKQDTKERNIEQNLVIPKIAKRLDFI